MLSSKATQASKVIKTNNFKTSLVKVPDLYDIERGNDSIPESVMEYLLFEQVGSQELLLLSRSDMINGQNINYRVINNLSELAFDYSSANVISVPGVLAEIFKRFGIVLENYVPELDAAATNESPNAYLDTDEESTSYKSVVVEFKNIQNNMNIELQIVASESTNYTGRGLAE